MKKRVFVSVVSAAAVALCAVVTMRAQDVPTGAPIATLPFHLVENFFHYPAYSVIGRLSGVAVGPNGHIVALNRGYHPVLEFNADGSFIRTWGEGSRMFEGAHALARHLPRVEKVDASTDKETSGTSTRRTT